MKKWICDAKHEIEVGQTRQTGLDGMISVIFRVSITVIIGPTAICLLKIYRFPSAVKTAQIYSQIVLFSIKDN